MFLLYERYYYYYCCCCYYIQRVVDVLFADAKCILCGRNINNNNNYY